MTFLFFLSRKTGIHERLSNYEFSLSDVECLSKSAAVAIWNGKVIGVCFLSQKEDDHLRAISLLAVDPEHQNKKIGKNLLLFAIKMAQEEGAIQIRLVVNAHSISSFSLYARVGFEVVEPMCLLRLTKETKLTPILVKETWNIRRFQKSDSEMCKSLFKKVVGFNRISNLEYFHNSFVDTGYPLYCPWVLEDLADLKIKAFVSGFTWDNYSVAENQEYWKYLILSVFHNLLSEDIKFEKEDPQIMIPILSQSECFRWCLQVLNLKIVKNEILMAIGNDNRQVCGIYMGGVEY